MKKKEYTKYFKEKVSRGMADLKAGRVIPHEKVKNQIANKFGTSFDEYLVQQLKDPKFRKTFEFFQRRLRNKLEQYTAKVTIKQVGSKRKIIHYIPPVSKMELLARFEWMCVDIRRGDPLEWKTGFERAFKMAEKAGKRRKK